MATPLADAIFWIAAVAIVIAQLLILRSTRRGMRHGAGGGGSVIEWAYAIVPALALVVLLLLTWQTMHPGTIQAVGPSPVLPGISR